jgi:hypothetical protein
MAQATGTTDTFDLVGMAEDVESTINDISPMETPFYTKAKRKTASNVLHQWQTDALASANANRAIEGDDSTYATVTPTTMLSNYTQISKKTTMISGTADKVKKYGRATEFAYQITKRGKEIKRDIEYACVGQQASSAGSSSVARSSAGAQSMIGDNRILTVGNSTGTAAGYAAGLWDAAVSGTATAMTEADLVSALEAAWTDGGDASTVLVGATLKKKIGTFAGASSFAGVSVNQGRTSQGVIVGGVDLYISPFGEHKIVLERFGTATTLLALDMDYWSVAFLRPIKFEPRAKTGDAEKGEILCEWCLVGDNPSASSMILGAT